MRLAIDASNIRGIGGGVTHLRELLRAAQSENFGLDQVFIWGGAATLSEIKARPGLEKCHAPLLDRSLPFRTYWQLFLLDRAAQQKKCDILFVPGGSYAGHLRPFVAMSQNLLPFQWTEARRFGASWWTLKFLLLRWAQSATFERADGLICLTDYASKTVRATLKKTPPRIAVIPHGVDDALRRAPRAQKPVTHYSNRAPFRLLYVSPIQPYKHQWHVVEAVWQLRQSGLPISIEFVGVLANSKKRFEDVWARCDPKREWVRVTNEMDARALRQKYHQADAFVFASSCETLSITLLEAMAAGLPIACANTSAMPEVLGDAGVYFDPEQPSEIAAAIRQLLENPDLREQKAWLAYERAQAFTWERCARETFSFLAQVASASAIR